ncbi:hypothetical protein MIND_00599100 [Mycena indigotica]|uniref:Uncharacterized protein n=1 Tax=Mycena indigotica TaxID=2126181 RepID=A0A8H6SRR5_9AGAR|nr:uncharacterized protein MIND_00599100 [Mycena indigotica]KAF7303697.1 hypothetical protein MIND_00599100 [Mycena indigotica]
MSFDLRSPAYSGVHDAIAKPGSQYNAAIDSAEEERMEREQKEIEDDLDGEQEAYGFPRLQDLSLEQEEDESEDDEADEDEDATDQDEAQMSSLPQSHTTSQIDLGSMKKVIAEASKGLKMLIIYQVDYSIEKFMHDKGFIPEGKQFFSPTPVADSATFLVAWIMSECDDINLDGTAKPSGQVHGSYSHAQKMRAAATYGFGRIADLGSRPWERVDSYEVSGARTWRWMGNPSVSETVSRYMITLRKKKVRAGEVATSARAITPEMLYKLYHFNNQPEVSQIKPITRKSRKSANLDNWCGGALEPCYMQSMYLHFCVYFGLMKLSKFSIKISDVLMNIALSLPFLSGKRANMEASLLY